MSEFALSWDLFGYECQSLGNCLKADIFRIESIHLLSDMAFHYSSVFLLAFLQINYLNKALDTFNTAVISPVYYVMFTSLTILASMIMFKDWNSQNASQIVTEVCGFITILSGTFLLHRTKDMGNAPISKSSPETPVSTKENSTTSANTEEQQMTVF